MNVVKKEWEFCKIRAFPGKKNITGRIWMICPKMRVDGRHRIAIFTFSTST